LTFLTKTSYTCAAKNRIDMPSTTFSLLSRWKCYRMQNQKGPCSHIGADITSRKLDLDTPLQDLTEHFLVVLIRLGLSQIFLLRNEHCYVCAVHWFEVDSKLGGTESALNHPFPVQRISAVRVPLMVEM